MRLLATVVALYLWPLTFCRAQHFPLDFINDQSETFSAHQFLEKDELLLSSLSGLYRFDGRTLHNYGRSFGPPGEGFAVVMNGDDMWIIGGSGLFRKTEEAFETLSRNYHDAGMRLERGLVFTWFDTTEGQRDKPLEWFDNATANSLHPKARMLSIAGHGALKLDRQGALWFPCASEVCVIEDARSSSPDTFTMRRLGKGAGLPADLWESVLKDSQGRVWVRNRAHVFVADSENAPFSEVLFNGQPAGEGRALFEDTDGSIWVSGVAGLLHDEVGHRRFFPAGMFQQRALGAITALYRDGAGNLWLSSDLGGTARWPGGGAITNWGPRDGLTQAAYPIFADRCGRIYAHHHDGIYRLAADEKKWEPFNAEKNPAVTFFPGQAGKGPLIIGSAPIDRDRKQWVFYSESDCRLVPSKPRLLNFPADPIRIRGLKEDSNGTLWFATMNGLFAVSTQNRWRHFTASDGMLQTTLQCLGIGSEDSIWVGSDTPVGFSRLSPLGHDLSGNPVWKHFPSKPEGYFNSTFYVTSDSNGNIWRGTGKGIQVSDGQHTAMEDWRPLDVHDGFAGNDQGLDGFYVQLDGTAWVATDGGITRFSRNFSPLVERTVQATIVDRRWLDSDHRSAEFDIAIVPASLGHEAQIEYRLAPGNWTKSDALTLKLLNLKKGPHQLEVRVAHNRWLKNQNIAVASFVTGAPFPYVNWTVSTVAIIAVASALFFLWRRRTDYWRLKALYGEVRHLGPEERTLRLQRLPIVLRSKLRILLTQETGHDDATGGRLAGRFLLEHVLARGGFATVYFARDLQQNDAPVAVKIIRENRGRAEWLQRKWSTEQRLLSTLDHPGIVRPRFAGLDPTLGMFIATDYIEGVTLRACLNHGPLSLDRIAARVRELCDALGHAHGKGVIHCDLKPDNVMLRRPGEAEESALLIDFGVAVLRTGTEAVTATAHVAGALDYMAPEQLGGSISEATDLYSLAAIVFEMLTGSRWREAEACRGVHTCIAALALPQKSEADLAGFFEQALSFQQHDRIQSAQEFQVKFLAAAMPALSRSATGATR